jgi:hypothetical protein
MKIVVNTNRINAIFQFVPIFGKLPMLNITFGAVGAGAELRYGSVSTKKMKLLAAPAPQH